MLLRKSGRASVLFLAVSAGMCGQSMGVGYTWNLGTGLTGLWNTNANWTPVGTPIAGDTVSYTGGGTYTTTLGSAQAADSLSATLGTLTLRSSTAVQRTLSLTSGGGDLVVTGATTLNVGLAANPLVVNVGDSVSVGTTAASNSLVVIDGAANQLNMQNFTGTAAMSIGLNGGTGAVTYRSAQGNLAAEINVASSSVAATRGTINVENGANVQMPTLIVADIASSLAEGTINITGTSSTLSVTDSLTLGNTTGSGLATINVGSGSTLNLQTSGHSVRSNGRILVSGGTVTATTGIDVIGGLIDVTSGGSLSLGLSSSTINNGGTVNMGSGAVIGGLVLVTGAGSSLNASATLTINAGSLRYAGTAFGSLGSLVVTNGGTLTVDAGSTVQATSLASGSVTLAGNVDISGTLALAPTSGFSIDSATPGGVNGVEVFAGGVFTTGTGSSTIRNGNLKIAGAVTTNGSLSVNSGGYVELNAATSALTANQNVIINSGGWITGGSSSAFTLAATKSLTTAGSGKITLAGSRTYNNNVFNIGGTAQNSLGSTLTTLNSSTLNVTTGVGGNLTATTLDVNNSSVTVTGGTVSVTNLVGSGASTVITSQSAGTINVAGNTTLANNAVLRELGTGHVNLNGGVSASGGASISLLNGVATGGNWNLTGSTVSIAGELIVSPGDGFSSFSSSTSATAYTINGAGSISFLNNSTVAATGAGASFIGTVGTGPTDIRFSQSSFFASSSIAQLIVGSTSSSIAQSITMEVSDNSLIDIGTIFIAASTLPVNVNFTNSSDLTAESLSITGNNAAVTVESQSQLAVDGIFLQNGGHLNLNGGTLTTLGIGFGGGSNHFNWVSGTVQLTNASTTQTLGSSNALGTNLNLDLGKTLDVNGTLAVPTGTSVHLAGGILEVGAMSNTGGQIILDSGILRFTNTSAAVGAGTALGSQLTLKSDLTINAAQIVNAGLIVGSGTVNARLLNDAAGELRLDLLSTARFNSPSTGHTNNGRVVLNGGRLDLNHSLDNGPSGDITGRGTLSTTGLNNAGDVALSGGVSDIYGDVNNQSGGRIILSGNSNTSFWGDVNNGAGASLRVSPGSVATFFGTYGGGSITGGGTVYFEADVTPGFSPALINISGDVIFSQSSNLIMEFAGAVRGTEYDAMNVGGTVALRGALSLEMLGGYVPAYLTSHQIIDASLRDGVFRLVSGIAITPTKYFAVTYSGADVFVTAALPGDANIDGTVNFDDLLTLAQNYNGPGTQIWQSGDFTGNAAVDFDDLLLLAQFYNQSVLQSGSLRANDLMLTSSAFASDWALAQSLVPEPASIAILCFAVVPMARRRVR